MLNIIAIQPFHQHALELTIQNCCAANILIHKTKFNDQNCIICITFLTPPEPMPFPPDSHSSPFHNLCCFCPFSSPHLAMTHFKCVLNSYHMLLFSTSCRPQPGQLFPLSILAISLSECFHPSQEKPLSNYSTLFRPFFCSSSPSVTSLSLSLKVCLSSVCIQMLEDVHHELSWFSFPPPFTISLSSPSSLLTERKHVPPHF